MRFDRTQKNSAQDIVNTYNSNDLSILFQKYADFTVTKADQIAFAITKYRSNKKIETTNQLKDIL